MRPFHVVTSLVLVSVSAFGWRAVGGEGEGEGGNESELTQPPPPANTAFAAVLMRMGLGADALAAAGVSAQQTTALVQAVAAVHSAATLDQLDYNYAEARRSHDTLARKVRSGRGSAEDRTTLASAAATLATAEAARNQHIATGRAAGLATLRANQVTTLQRIHGNASWGLPMQYLAKDRTEAEWVELRGLVASKRIADRDEEETFPAAAASALAAIDGVSEISTAKANLETGIFDVQTAWNAAASE
jgi:hypothetical protein